MMIFIGFPVTWLRLVIRVTELRTLAAGLISLYMPLPYTKKLNLCNYIINLLYLKLW